MEAIITEFTEGNYRYRQLARQGRVAIYEQQHKDNPKVVRFEVIRIRIQREHTWPDGTTTPEKEAYPSPGSWGKYAWTCFTLPEAEALMQTLLRPPEEGA